MSEAKPIMIFKVYADNKDVSNLECPYGAVTMIPFRATVESELFTGETLPGAVDVQIENPGMSRNMCAKYMFKGIDRDGNPCQLFVKNDRSGFMTFSSSERSLTRSPKISMKRPQDIAMWEVLAAKRPGLFKARVFV